MNANHTKGKLISRSLLYCFLLCLAFILVHGYRVTRSEHLCTRFSAQLTDGQHEFVVALPAGGFHIQFTAEPNVSTMTIVHKEQQLPAARISTSILRRDGSVLVRSTQEYLEFDVRLAEAYRPLRVLISVTRTNESKIYMNVGTGI